MYVVSYLAFSIPAVIAGVLITHLGLRNTALGYGSFVAAIALLTVITEAYLTARTARSARFERRWLRDWPSQPRGRRAERAALHFGARLDPACLGSCRCLMLIPMLAPSGRLLWALG